MWGKLESVTPDVISPVMSASTTTDEGETTKEPLVVVSYCGGGKVVYQYCKKSWGTSWRTCGRNGILRFLGCPVHPHPSPVALLLEKLCHLHPTCVTHDTRSLTVNLYCESTSPFDMSPFQLDPKTLIYLPTHISVVFWRRGNPMEVIDDCLVLFAGILPSPRTIFCNSWKTNSWTERIKKT
jgi:hypothetical protein